MELKKALEKYKKDRPWFSGSQIETIKSFIEWYERIKWETMFKKADENKREAQQ